MAVRIGHASISENGTTSGKAGDQTGKEVCIRDWYNKSWDYMAIHPDAAVREKHAKAVEAACLNDNIGYNWFGESSRNSLNDLAKNVGYDLSKVGLCNCDCSSLQNVAAVASGSGATYGSNGWTTSTMKSPLKALGYVIITDKTYLSSADYAVRGAIYVKESSHTICALDNGASYQKTLALLGGKVTASTPVQQQPTTSSKVPYLVRIKIDDLNIRTGPGTNYSKVGKYTGIGTFTIVEEKSGAGSKTGWGRLKSGIGWVSLDYCTKV